MKPVTASLPAPMLVAMLAAALSACGPADEPPPPPAGEDQALERAEAMLQERPEAPQPAADSSQP